MAKKSKRKIRVFSANVAQDSSSEEEARKRRRTNINNNNITLFSSSSFEMEPSVHHRDVAKQSSSSSSSKLDPQASLRLLGPRSSNPMVSNKNICSALPEKYE